METLIRKASPDHPRLLLGKGEEEALLKKIASVSHLDASRGHVLAVAEEMLALPPVERVKTGRRLLGVSRTCVKRVMYLGLAYRLSGDERFLRRAEKEMLSAAAFSDWNPSHFLDVAEMTAALAIGYDWLYHELDPEARTTLGDAIVEKGLRTSLKHAGWVALENNWNQVCHGGLVLGALAVMEDEPELAARIVKRAVEYVPRAMATYAPDGAYPEGPTYWAYGTTYNVLMIDALESVLGSDFGLSQSEGFMESADYFLHVTGPSHRFFNYSDSGNARGVRPANYWFVARRGDPSLLWFERPALREFLSKPPRAGGSSYRFFPLVLVWADATGTVPAPAALHWRGRGTVPVGLHRSGWAPEDIFVGVKGGSPGASHAHMDVGSFVMEADGVRWAVDLGGQGYHKIESQGIGLWDRRQDGDRWTIFRLNNLSHNTLVVDGQLQRVKGHAPIIGSSDRAPMPHTIVDMSAVYDGQLAEAKRGVGLLPNRSVVVRDEIKALEKATSIRWGMVTEAEVTIEDHRAARLEQRGKRLVLRVKSPESARLAIFETGKPPRDYDDPNPGTRMIGFEVDVPPGAEESLVVLLEPGGVGEGMGPVGPLAEW